MHCRGKCLQLAALLLAVACGPAAGAAVHRARGVDFITAQLIGSSVSSHVRQTTDDRPNAHFSRDAWQPVQEDSRDLVPQPRAVTETEAVVVSSELKPKPNDESKRGPEVEDSIAAVTSQLLNNPQTVLDVRTPPAKKQEVEPSPDKKWQQMQMVQTNTNITIKGTAQTPLVVSNETPTRFPPRVTSTPAAVNATKKPTAATVVLEKQTTIPTPVKKPTTAPPKTTKKEVVTTTPASVKPTAATVVKKVEQPANKRPAVSPPFTILNRIEAATSTTSAPTTEKFKPTAQTTVKFKPTAQTTEKFKPIVQTTVKPAIRRGTVTTVAPVTVVTESIPTVATTTTKPMVKSTKKPVPKPYRAPSASVVTRPPQAISTFIPETFEILSTEKATTKVATTTTTPAPTTTTTTTTAAPVTEKSKKKKKNKKNKKRRRRPSSKPENKIDSELEEKEEKPLTSRIIDYLSGEGIPSFGTTVVGLLMTAGLAGLLFFPMEGFARRSDHFKREDENEGLMPSILKAVYTSMHPHPENDLHTEEQGPRRFRRNLHRRTKRQYRFERVPYRPVPEHLRSPMYKQASADSTNIMQIEAGGNQPFSLVRLVKQMLAVKLDVLSNVLRMASEQLRNYAQNAEVQRPPKPSTTTTTTEPATETATDVEAETTEVPSEEMVLVKAPTTTTTTTTTTTEPLNDEENLIRRRTAD